MDVSVAQFLKACWTSGISESANSVSCLIGKQALVKYNENGIILKYVALANYELVM